MKCLPELPLLVGIQKVYSTRINTPHLAHCVVPPASSTFLLGLQSPIITKIWDMYDMNHLKNGDFP